MNTCGFLRSAPREGVEGTASFLLGGKRRGGVIRRRMELTLDAASRVLRDHQCTLTGTRRLVMLDGPLAGGRAAAGGGPAGGDPHLTS